MSRIPHPMVYRIGAVGLFSLFMCIMVGVGYIAMTRQSGRRGIDVSMLLPQEEKQAVSEELIEKEDDSETAS